MAGCGPVLSGFESRRFPRSGLGGRSLLTRTVPLIRCSLAGDGRRSRRSEKSSLRSDEYWVIGQHNALDAERNGDRSPKSIPAGSTPAGRAENFCLRTHQVRRTVCLMVEEGSIPFVGAMQIPGVPRASRKVPGLQLRAGPLQGST